MENEYLEAEPQDAQPSPEASPEPSPLRLFGLWLRETSVVLVLALALSVLLRTFIFQAFYVPSVSMMDTLNVNDRIVASKLSYRFGEVHRGDIIVFHDPSDWLSELPVQEGWQGKLSSFFTWIGVLPSNSGDDLVKRVIGLPGDHVKCCSPDGQIIVNGKALDEQAYAVGSSTDVTFDIVVPAGRVFVMGDNREHSADSRYHLDDHFGTVPMGNIVGQVVALVWPIERFDLPGNPMESLGIPAPGQ